MRSVQSVNDVLSSLYHCILIHVPCSLIDRRGYVVPDASDMHMSTGGSGRESKSVNLRHENYGSTTVTQKVRVIIGLEAFQFDEREKTEAYQSCKVKPYFGTRIAGCWRDCWIDSRSLVLSLALYSH